MTNSKARNNLDSGEIRIAFTYTKYQVVSAWQLHYSNTLHPRRDLIIAGILLVAGLFFLNIPEYSLIGIFVMIGAGILFLMLFLAFFIIPPMMYNRDPKFWRPYEFHFSNECIEFKTNRDEAKVEWNTYGRVIENDQVFLMYHRKGGFTIIPKPSLGSEKQIAAFRELFAKAVQQLPTNPANAGD